jgi:hypothetical protein
MTWHGFPVLELAGPRTLRAEHTAKAAQRVARQEFPPPFVRGTLEGQAAPRPVDELMQALVEAPQSISALEWVLIVSRKTAWDRTHPELAAPTAEAAWRLAWSSRMRAGTLIRRLFRQRGGRGGLLAPSLAAAFDEAATSAPADFQLPVATLKALGSPSPGRALAQLGCRARVTPLGLKQACEVSEHVPVLQQAYSEAVSVWMAASDQGQEAERWLVDCLQEMAEAEAIGAVEQLLSRIAPDNSGQYRLLVRWLEQHFGPTTDGAQRWARLTARSQQALRDWIGSVNYKQFEGLVLELLDKAGDKLDERAQNQLLRRVAFWHNYSRRFERVRFLLPRSSASVLGIQKFDTRELSQLYELDLLAGGYTQSTEVGIFDLGAWFVIEFFRGRGSETVLVEANAELANLLFLAPRLSLMDIRDAVLRSGNYEVSDHVVLWQHFLERKLARRGISPNQGVKTFRLLPDGKHSPPYDFRRGMPPPRDETLADRAATLPNWERTVQQLYAEAKAVTARKAKTQTR